MPFGTGWEEGEVLLGSPSPAQLRWRPPDPGHSSVRSGYLPGLCPSPLRGSPSPTWFPGRSGTRPCLWLTSDDSSARHPHPLVRSPFSRGCKTYVLNISHVCSLTSSRTALGFAGSLAAREERPLPWPSPWPSLSLCW